MNDHPEIELALQKNVKRRDFLKMAAALGGSAMALSQTRFLANAAEPKTDAKKIVKPAATHAAVKGVPAEHPMHGYNAAETIQPMTFPNLSNVEGISQNQLNQHIELYNGYVKKINDIQGQINGMTPELDKMNATYSVYRGLHVEQTYALNGVILHEYYFENMGGAKTPATETGLLEKIITQEFGSWQNYINHLLAVGKSMRGWAITGYNMRDHRVHNYGLDLHNQWVPVNVIPLLVLDVYEHAYMIDFGTKRPAYLEAFMKNVNWQVVENRLKTMILHG